MRIRDFLTSFSSFRNNIRSWFKSPDTRGTSIIRNQTDKLVDADINAINPWSKNNKNKDNLDDSQQTNSKQNSNRTQQNGEAVSNYSFPQNGTNGNVANRVYQGNLSVENRLITDYQSRLPPLTAKKDRYLQSYRGRYKITELIKDDIKLREYKGFTYPQNKAVRIKEYFLSNVDETKVRELKNRTNIKLKTTSGQDFRFITPLDTFTDGERCYVITQSNLNYITIREFLSSPDKSYYLKNKIFKIIQQVLQSLYFLHTQNIDLGNSNNISGIAHGNISIDSLLIETKDIQENQFFVYLSNLAIWKDIIEYQNINHYSCQTMKKNDLINLGYVAVTVLLSDEIASGFISRDELAEPENIIYWLNQKTTNEKAYFILQLLEVKEPFNNTKEAHDKISELLSNKNQYQPEEVSQKIQPTSDIKENKNNKIFLIVLVSSFSSLIGILLLVWFINEKRGADKVETGNQNKVDENCCINKVNFANIIDNKKEVKYYIQDSGVWDYLLTKPNLVAYKKTLIQEIGNRLSDERGKNIIDKYEPVKVKAENIEPKVIQEKINQGEIDFALLTEEIPQNDLDELNLEQKVIAYDALVAIVAYSDARNKLSFPDKLNHRITIDKLRELYTNDDDEFINNQNNKQILSGISKNKEIKLYFPDIRNKQNDDTKSEIAHLFEEKIFANNAEDSNNFKELKQKILEREIKINKPSEPNNKRDESYMLQSKYIFQYIRKDFEREKKLGIGISLLSRVYGQCSVYPLTIKGNDFTFEPFIQNNDNPINPNIDLCNDKGSYKPNHKALNDKDNSLRFPLVVVYKQDSEYAKKFVEIMQTQEGQTLLKEAGFIPAKSPSENESSTEA